MWITKREAAEAVGITIRWVELNIAKNKYATKTTQARSTNGKPQTLIELNSLPLEAQVRWYEKHKTAKERFPTDLSWFSADLIREALRRRQLIQGLEEFLTTIPKKQRTEAARKWAQVKGESIGTLYKYRKTYYDSGEQFSSLIPLWGKRKNTRKLSSWEIGRITQLYLNNKALSAAVCYRIMQEEAAGAGASVASYSTYLRFINEGLEQIVKTVRHPQKFYKDNFEYIMRRGYRDLASNQIYCGDHHQFDIFVIDERGQAIRPWMTGFEDMRSRSLPGFCIVDIPSSRSIASALRHAILPKEHANYIQYGIPKEVYIDNGRDYLSGYVGGGSKRIGKIDFDIETKGVLAELDIVPRNVTPELARAKPIERFFRTIEDQLIKGLPGYCGRSPQHRPDDLKGKTRKELKRMKLLTVDQFREFVTSWIANRYHLQSHRGEGMDGKSPYQVWKENLNGLKTVNEEVLNLLLMPSKKAKVTNQGIWFKGHLYELTEQLLIYIGSYVEIRYDPNQMGRIWVFDDKFICTTESKRLMRMDATEEDFKRAAKIRKTQRKLVKDRICQLTAMSKFADPLEQAVAERTGREKVPVRRSRYQETFTAEVQKGRKTHKQVITTRFEEAARTKETEEEPAILTSDRSQAPEKGIGQRHIERLRNRAKPDSSRPKYSLFKRKLESETTEQ